MRIEHGRRAVILSSAGLLAACAVKPVLLDRSSMADVKRIAVPTPGFPSSPSAEVINGMGSRLGLIGLVSSSIVVSNRADALAKLMKARSFEPERFFTDALGERLKGHGLSALAVSADAARQDFLKSYSQISAGDAVLDVYISRYGFIALDDSDDSPYQPAVTAGMRLVGVRDKSVLMQDFVSIDAVEAPPPEVEGGPAPVFKFTNFGEIAANPDRAVSALRIALSAAADSVVKRLS